MKLLIDLQGAQTKSGVRGIGRLSRSLARAIVARGGDHDISLLLNAALPHNIKALKAEFAALLPPGRILTFQVPAPVAEHDPANLWRARSAEIIRETFIARHKPDVLFITSLFEGFLDDAVTSIGALDAPHVTAATLYDLIPLLNPAQYLAQQGPRRHYLRRAQALKRADLLIAISESARREAVDLLDVQPDRVAVMPLGVDGDFRDLSLSPVQKELLCLQYGLRPQFILYVGAVDPRKNVQVLLEAFAMLPPDVRSVHGLVLAGSLEEDERKRVRAIGARYGVGANELVFCGYVSDADLVRLYNACALFVFPSKHEGFGLPVLEALACGAPVLAADSTSLPEVVNRRDLLFAPDKAADLASKMLTILRDAGLRDDVRRWGFERAAHFTWEHCADRALQALEAVHQRQDSGSGLTKRTALQPRKRLAFFSPLPDDRSGIAHYSTGLLKELARYYEIDCILGEQTEVADEWIIANFALQDIRWFERNATSYDRIVYAIGNSDFHSHMLDLLQRFPGVVILHDFFLSDLIDWMCTSGILPPEEFPRELYRTHGWTGLLASHKQGRLRAVEDFACNDIIFRNATGVIVHSHYAVDRACALYGDAVADEMAVIPLLHAPLLDVQSRSERRAAVRARLGIHRDAFVVCSFGLITKRKLSRKLLEAWTGSPLGEQPDAMLVFVGEASSSEYGYDLESAVGAHSGASAIMVTGYAAPELYQDYLAAADLAVQLRIESRGETSGAVLDCLAAGIPVIVNAHGTACELPDDVVYKLPETFAGAELSHRIRHFQRHREAALALGRRGQAYIAQHHHPEKIGEAFHQAIEGFARHGARAQQQTVLSALSNVTAPVAPLDSDFSRVVTALSGNAPAPRRRQILYDVTVLAEQDSKTGIQRVVRSILMRLVQSPPPGFRIEPVRIDGSAYRYARQFVGEVLGVPGPSLPDALADFAGGDIYLAVDWVPDRLPQVEEWLSGFSDAGGKVVFCIYDLLPLQMPQYFPGFMSDVTQRWFDSALAVADQFICISRNVADDVARFAAALGASATGERGVAPGCRKIAIDYFHLGSDLAASLPTRGVSTHCNLVLTQMQARRSFLMVGTVEPRKGHLQVIQAFDILWRQGADIGLVIVGKQGWMVDSVSDTFARHRERERRLFWLQSASDEMLDKLYAASSALIAASMGEGFGLPLIETAQHGRPLIARDIPVFREVAGEHAFYFEAAEPDELAAAIQHWIELDTQQRAPSSEKMPYLSWKDSTKALLAALFAEQPYKSVSID